jgi:hypothetical protein
MPERLLRKVESSGVMNTAGYNWSKRHYADYNSLLWKRLLKEELVTPSVHHAARIAACFAVIFVAASAVAAFGG